MQPIDSTIRRRGYFLRRRDILTIGYTDADLTTALASKRIFRVRQGWYSVPDAPEAGVRAVRVGGRLTSLSALESYGLRVPRRNALHVAVRSTASRLRDPADKRARLERAGVVVHWTDQSAGGSAWRVSVQDALLDVLKHESRHIALACCGAALHHRLLTERELDRVFARAPERVQSWRALVSGLDESHGETEFRVKYAESGRSCEQQVVVGHVGRFDFRVGRNTYVEIDGGQHDPGWTGDSPSSWEHDLERDAAMTILGNRVLHFGYRQLYRDWDTVLAAIDRAIADGEALATLRQRHPYRSPVSRKRRRNRQKRASG